MPTGFACFSTILWLFEVNRGFAFVRLLFVVWLEVIMLFSPGSAGAGGADAASLADGVAEAVGVAGFEFGDAVEAFGAGVRHAGQDVSIQPIHVR
jgi:hypothetical protein